ncbi:MAG TPA: cupredoxin domain-containing protein, partial [Oscillatoriales cyanobacterium M59_W2019_021]
MSRVLKKSIFINFLSSIALLGSMETAVAKIPEPPTGDRFQLIEQPLPLKIGVTLGGIALIGLELWWFLGSKTQAQAAKTQGGVQEIEITVEGGYSPDRITVNVAQAVRLKFVRKDPSSCLEKVILPDFHKAVDLPLHRPTVVEFTPQTPGTYPFHCGMNMFRGAIEVKEPRDVASGIVLRNRFLSRGAHGLQNAPGDDLTGV